MKRTFIIFIFIISNQLNLNSKIIPNLDHFSLTLYLILLLFVF